MSLDADHDLPGHALPRIAAQQPAIAAPVDQQRLEVALRAALLDAVLRGNAHIVADLAQRDVAAPRAEAQPALKGFLLQIGDVAGMAARRDLRAPIERLQLARFHRHLQVGGVARISGVAADARAVALHGGELLAELEALALL